MLKNHKKMFDYNLIEADNIISVWRSVIFYLLQKPTNISKFMQRWMFAIFYYI